MDFGICTKGGAHLPCMYMMGCRVGEFDWMTVMIGVNWLSILFLSAVERHLHMRIQPVKKEYSM